MHTINHIMLLFMLAAVAAFGAGATSVVVSAPDQLPDTIGVRKAQYELLRRARTAADSILPLYNLYDLEMNGSDAPPIMWQLYHVAQRAGDVSTRLDMIRNLANLYLRNDSVLMVLEQAAMGMPTSEDKLCTLTFVRVNRAGAAIRYATAAQRDSLLGESMREMVSAADGSVYDDVLRLFKLVLLLGGETQGALLTNYMDMLNEAVGRLPASDIGLRNKFYSQSAISYTNNGDAVRAIRADRALLSIMDELERKYHREGRPYRHFDRNRYIVYRRILNNYKVLSLKDTEAVYAAARTLAMRNPLLKADFERYQRPDICLMMRRGQYREAIPVLNRQVEQTKDFYQRRFLLRQLRKAATEVGDNATLASTAIAYNEMLEEYISHKNSERYRELEMIYGVDKLRSEISAMELERQRGRTQSYRVALIVGLVALGIVLVLCVVLGRLYGRSRRMANELRDTAARVRSERDILAQTQRSLIESRDRERRAQLQKSEFISNISHEVNTPLRNIVEYSQIIVDCIDGPKQAYLQRFGQLVSLNAEHLQTLFNDVLTLATTEQSRMTLELKTASVHQMCRLAVENARVLQHPGVTLTFDDGGQPDKLVSTDPQRVQMVLGNLISNGLKFTEEGSVTLTYRVDTDSNKLVFTVTDTGIGIPTGEEERIFGQFEKLDRFTQGIGLGLSICRVVSRLLGGDVHLDRSYHRGARFEFEIPLR